MEVVLAVGVISIAVVALLGLLAPTIGSVRHIVDKDKSGHLEGMVRSYIDEELTYDTISDDLAGGTTDPNARHIFYVWQTQTDALNDDDIVTHYQDDLTGYNSAGPDNVGLPHVVVLSPLTIGNNDYDYGNADQEGYIPFRVRMYQFEPNTVGNVATNPALLTESRLIFDYPSAKLQ